MKTKKWPYNILFLFVSFLTTAQELVIDFNDHSFNEASNKLNIIHPGVTLVNDRFGNELSAAQIHGHETSYINLGTSPLLKKSTISISLWVNFDRRNYIGRGYDHNPVFLLRNSENEDFNVAYGLAVDWHNGKFVCNSALDSSKEVLVYSVDKVKMMKWYHVVMVCSDKEFAFYVDGKLQAKMNKNFETQFLKNDSLTLGYNSGIKNRRYSYAVFDDIKIFHEALNADQVLDLYREPNPNRLKAVFRDILGYLLIIVIFILAIIAIQYRNRQKTKRQRQEFELLNKISELELKVVKAQINPHFISNSMAAIQDLIYKMDIDGAAKYVSKFSYFLRSILTYSDKNFITLAKELEIIKLNVELELLRFKDKFDFILVVSDEVSLDEIEIPALITQPLIENAIWHGLLPLEGLRQPMLKVNVFLAKGKPVIEIEDNGVGRSDKANPDSKGMKLVQDKILSLNKLLGNFNYKMDVQDLVDDRNEPLGTKVVIQLDKSVYDA